MKVNSITNLNKIRLDVGNDPREQFGLDVLMGLSSSPKSVPPKYFYDDEGSRLFQKIMGCKDYYPTKCEFDILQKDGPSIMKKLAGSGPIQIVELGAGDGLKTKELLKHGVDSGLDFSYLPVDISEGALLSLVDSFEGKFPNCTLKPIQGEYFRSLKWISGNLTGKKLVLFLGSNLGNFNKAGSEVFLKTMWNALDDGDHVLLGADLKKDMDALLWAYNDREGHTKAFNLNLLNRINRELGGDFDPSQFRHYGTYNVAIGAMESFLISVKKQKVRIEHLNKNFSFGAYEPVHVEFSFKYLPEDIEELAKNTGYELCGAYYDDRNYFGDFLLKVVKR